MRKLFTLLIFTLFWAGSSWCASVTIGTGTSTGRYPLNDYFAHSSSQSLYLASEIGASGTITNIRWYRNDVGANSNAIGTTEIWLMETPNSVLTGTTWEGPGTLVATISNIDLGAGGGWLDIPINSFVYNGTDNLLVSVRTQNAPYTPPHSYWRYTSTSTAYLMRAGNSDTQNPPTLYLSYSRPNIQLEMIVVVNDPPNCTSLLSPADNATNVLSTATLNWAEAGGFPTGYKLYFGTDNPPTNLVNGTDLGNVTTYDPTPDLSYNTPYYWKVVPYNANGDATGCATWSFTTMADPTLSPPFTQAFDTYPPINWTESQGLLAAPTILSGTSSSWGADGFANVGTTGSARLNIYGTTRKEWMFTPPIDLGTGSVDYQLRFNLALTAFSSTGAAGTTGTDDKFAVVISTDNGATWTSANTLRLWDNAGSAYVYNDIATAGETVIIDLSAYSGVVKIGFYGESTVTNADNDLFVDNVTVEEIPTAPVFAITPPSKDFGTVGVGESLSQVFTISNTGAGTLIIDPAISISGTNADQFILTDGNTYPLSLTVGQSATVSVAFMPTSEGVKNANLIIVDNLGAKTSNSVPLTGTGFERPAGSTCGNPYPVTLPLVDFAGNTDGMGDDYSSTWITPNSSYLNGDDMVFEFTLSAPGYLSGDLTSPDSWIGLFILDDCPNLATPAAVLKSATSSGSEASFTDFLLQPGTYFAIVSSFPSPQSIEFTLNLSVVNAEFGTLRGEITDCYSNALLEGVSVTAGSLSTTTDIDGYYEFQDVPVGTYDIVTSLSGYVNKTTSGVEVLNGQITNQNICMSIFVDPPENLQASVNGQDVHLTWNAPGTYPDSFSDGFESYPDFVINFSPWTNTDVDGLGTYGITGVTWANVYLPQAFMVYNSSTTTPPFAENLAHSGDKFAACFDAVPEDPIYNNNDWLISPKVTVVAGSELKFWARSYNDTYGLERFKVGISTTGTSVGDFTIISTGSYLEAGILWTEYTFDLSAYVGEDIHAAINCVSSDAFFLLVDDFSIGVPAKNAAFVENKPENISNQVMKLALPATPLTRQVGQASSTPEMSHNNNLATKASSQSAQAKAPLASFTGYNVYRDDVKIANNIPNLYYDDLNLPAGIYQFKVTAQYLESESEPIGPVIVEIITCVAPTDVVVTDITPATATISWTAGSPPPADGYEYEIRTEGDPGSGATGLEVSGTTAAGITTAAITGLADGEVYYVYVRAVCGTGNASNWAGAAFATPCYAQALPFTEAFETDSPTLGCWSIFNLDGNSNYWALSASYNHTIDGATSVRHSYGPSGTQEDGWLVSPALIIPAAGAAELSFWSYNSFPTFYGKNSVLVSTGSRIPADNEYTEIWTPATVVSAWEETVLDLSAFAGETIYIAFRYEGDDAHTWYIDDVSVSTGAATKTLNLTGIMLEGLYDGSGTMRQAFNETGPQFGAGIADEITVELHAAADYGTTVHTVNNVMLSTSGMATIDDLPGTFDGDYYITIRHRNSIETTSATAVSFAGSIINQSYAAPADVYGANLVQMIDGYYAIYGGDVNQDGSADSGDMTPVDNDAANFESGYLPTDVNGDGSIDSGDMTLIDNNASLFVGSILP